MSIRFAIKSTIGDAIKEGDTIVRFSGRTEAFKGSEERESKLVGIDAQGNPKVLFNTGLDPESVEFYKWYSDDEKKIVKQQIEEMRPLIVRNYGGEAVIDSSNSFFWKKNRDVNILSLNNEDLKKFYDTKYVTHALLYLSIISGAFMGMVAPTREWAEVQKIPLYMALETDDDVNESDDVTKSDAHAALGELRKEESTDALFILAWCIQYDTEKFGAYTRATSKRDLVDYHIRFIEGKLQTKKKKNCPKVFLDYVTKWKGQQTRPTLYTEAYVKAGDYYNFLIKRDKVFMSPEGTDLGISINEVVDNLQKKKFSKDLELLRDQVEAKWKE